MEAYQLYVYLRYMYIRHSVDNADNEFFRCEHKIINVHGPYALPFLLHKHILSLQKNITMT